MLIKTYYNQRDIINEIQEETGYSFYEIERVLSTLEFFIQEKLIDNDNNIEIKVFPGFKIKSQVVSANQYNSNLCKNGIINSDYILKLSAYFTDAFKRKIHKQIRDKRRKIANSI